MIDNNPPAPRTGARKHPPVRPAGERNDMVLENLKLVDWVVGGLLLGRAVAVLGVDDAVQCGRLGLMRAADLWDAARGVAFSTYAVRSIRNAIFRGADGATSIKVPAYARKDTYAGRPVRREVRAAAERALRCRALPRGGDDADEGNAPPAETSRAMQVFDPPAPLEGGELLHLVCLGVLTLPLQHAAAVRRCMLQGQTLEVAAGACGVSRESVRQALLRGKARLREWLLARGVTG